MIKNVYVGPKLRCNRIQLIIFWKLIILMLWDIATPPFQKQSKYYSTTVFNLKKFISVYDTEHS